MLTKKRARCIDMNLTEKKIAAALTAVVAYIQTEEEALVMQPEKLTLRKFINGNLWGISGRQDLMQMRNMMHMKAFSR